MRSLLTQLGSCWMKASTMSFRWEPVFASSSSCSAGEEEALEEPLRLQVSPGVSRCPQVSPGLSRCLQVSPGVSMCPQVSPGLSRCLTLLVQQLLGQLFALCLDGGHEGLQVHQVLVEVAGVLVLPDAALQVVLAGLPRREDVDAGAVLWEGRRPRQTGVENYKDGVLPSTGPRTLLHRLVLRQLRHVLVQQVGQRLRVGQQLLVRRRRLLVLLVTVLTQLPFGVEDPPEEEEEEEEEETSATKSDQRDTKRKKRREEENRRKRRGRKRRRKRKKRGWRRKSNQRPTKRRKWRRKRREEEEENEEEEKGEKEEE
ncbi:hypothetical protein EYF80_035030 [Liparis tanakae]|uniref:Uncharacterized protein n=1 Tax=Liparis tanakae TaxID=230148 RepID=A0A4Z2GMG3_9TELE|nr:hypothetical protein EYF80_035030 [Liparis tanakae]